MIPTVTRTWKAFIKKLISVSPLHTRSSGRNSIFVACCSKYNAEVTVKMVV